LVPKPKPRPLPAKKVTVTTSVTPQFIGPMQTPCQPAAGKTCPQVNPLNNGMLQNNPYGTAGTTTTGTTPNVTTANPYSNGTSVWGTSSVSSSKTRNVLAR